MTIVSANACDARHYRSGVGLSACSGEAGHAGEHSWVLLRPAQGRSPTPRERADAALREYREGEIGPGRAWFRTAFAGVDHDRRIVARILGVLAGLLIGLAIGGLLSRL